MLYPDVASRVEHKQYVQKRGHDNQKSIRSFAEREAVVVENFSRAGERWIPGIVSKVDGPLSYTVKLPNDTHVRRHVDNIRKRSIPTPSFINSDCEPHEIEDLSFDRHLQVNTRSTGATFENVVPQQNSSIPSTSSDDSNGHTIRRSTRITKPPNRLLNPIGY